MQLLRNRFRPAAAGTGTGTGVGAAMALVLALGAACFPAYGATEEAVQDMWFPAEERLQSQGALAEGLDFTEVIENPESLALIWLHARYHRVTGGPAAVHRAFHRVRRAAGLSEQSETALQAYLAQATSQNQRAVALLSAMVPPEEGTLDRFLFDARLADAYLSTGQGASADSLATRLEQATLLGDLAAGHADLLKLRIRNLRARLSGDPGVQEALAREVLNQGYRLMGARQLFEAARSRVGRDPARAEVLLEEVLMLTSGWEPDLGPKRSLDAHLKAVAMVWRGYVEELLGRPEESLHSRKRALPALRANGDSLAMAYTQMGIGWVAWLSRRPEEALAASREARELFAQLGVRWAELQAMHNLALVLSNTDQWSEARATWDEGIMKARAAGDADREGQFLNSLGVLAWREGRPDRAVEIYEQLLEVHRAAGDVPLEQQALNNLALANESMGRDEQAKVLYRRVLSLEVEGGYRDVASRINLARMILPEGAGEAEGLAREAVALVDEAPDPLNEALARQEWGRALCGLGREAEGLAQLKAAADILLEAGSRRERLPVLLRWGLMLRGTGNAGESARRLEQALAESKELREWDMAALAAAQTATSLLAGGDTLAARESVEEAFMLSRIHHDAGLPSDRGMVQAARCRALATLLESGGASPDATLIRDAFELLQRTKARSLLDLAESSGESIVPDLPDSLRERERRARLRVERLLDRLAEEASPHPRLVSALAEAEASFQAARRAVIRADERYSRAGAVTPVRVDALHAAADSSAVLFLDFLVGDTPGDPEPRPVYLFALDRHGLTVHRLGVYRDLKARCELFLDLIRTPPGSGGDGEILRRVAQELGEILLGPVAERFSAASQVVAATDGFVHQVPLAALVVPGREQYVVEQVAVTRTASLSDWAKVQGRETAGRSPDLDLAMWPGTARDLPAGTAAAAAESEAAGLARRFSRSAILRPQPGLAPLRALEEIGVWQNTRVIHFASHGFFDPRQPWRSGLYLTEETRLSVADVYYLNLDCDLVTLSACETARGEALPGEGLQGFTQALVSAGARSVLASLWPIDDAVTPVFMRRFYDALAEGRTRADALREAQLGFLGEPVLAHPFYWAPFTVWGDADHGVALERAPWWRRNALGAGAVAAGVLCLILGAVFWRRSP